MVGYIEGEVASPDYPGGDSRTRTDTLIAIQLFEVEREAAGRTFEERLALRQERSRPLADELGRWIAETSKTTPPKSPLGKALYYAAHRWTPLTRFLEDGRLEIHNNACERALRRVAVGWKQAHIAESLPGERAQSAAG